MLAEYDFSKGVRGKYARSTREGVTSLCWTCSKTVSKRGGYEQFFAWTRGNHLPPAIRGREIIAPRVRTSALFTPGSQENFTRLVVTIV